MYFQSAAWHSGEQYPSFRKPEHASTFDSTFSQQYLPHTFSFPRCAVDTFTSIFFVAIDNGKNWRGLKYSDIQLGIQNCP